MASNPLFIPVNSRFTKDGLEHLDTLASIAGVSRAEYLRILVEQEWDAYVGNPQLKAVVDQMAELAKQMKALSGSLPKEDSQA